MKVLLGKPVSVFVGFALIAVAVPTWVAGQGPPPQWLVDDVNGAIAVDGVVSAEGLQKDNPYYMLVRAQRPCTEWDALWAELPAHLFARVGCWQVVAAQGAQITGARSLVTFFLDLSGPRDPDAPRRVTEIVRNLDPAHRVLDAEVWHGTGGATATDPTRVLAIWRDRFVRCPDEANGNLLDAVESAIDAAGINGGVQMKDCRAHIVGPAYRPPPIPRQPVFAFFGQVINN